MESVIDSESSSLVPCERALTRPGHNALLSFVIQNDPSFGTPCSHENHLDRSERDLLADVILNLSSKILTLRRYWYL